MKPSTAASLKPPHRIRNSLIAVCCGMVLVGIGVWWNRAFIMEEVLVRLLARTPLLAPKLSGLQFGFSQANLAEMTWGLETGAGLLSATLADVTLSYDLSVPKVSAIAIGQAQLNFVYHTPDKAAVNSATPFGTLAYPLEQVSIKQLDLTAISPWGLSHIVGQADISRASTGLLQASFATADQALSLVFSAGLRSAQVLGKQQTGATVFTLDISHLDQADKQAHLQGDMGALGQWLTASPLVPEQARAKMATLAKAWLTPELALAKVTATVQATDKAASPHGVIWLTRDGGYLAKTEWAMAASGAVNATAYLDMTAATLLGFIGPWQPEVTRGWQLHGGQVQGAVQLRWQAQRPLAGTAHFSVFDLAVTADQTELNQVTIMLDVADLSRQAVAVSVTVPALAFGKKMALRDLNLKADYQDGKLTVGQGIGTLFGGQLAVLPATFDLKQRPILLTLQVRGVDVAQLLATLNADSLSGSGTVDGELPLSISATAIEVLDGTLTGTRPGVLHYQGPVADKENVAFRALRNLQYHNLQAKVNYRPNGDYHVGLRLEGSNPEVLSGHPLAFNLNLSGQLPELLQRGIMAGDFERAILKEAKSQAAPIKQPVTPTHGDHPPKPPPAERRP
ncbi:intermembrane phospholipid transport protein YdbH family protein [Methylovulum psychrotolerans]|nr:YdbH domain-containing protein [Methylovulum psychrotolerans]